MLFGIFVKMEEVGLPDEEDSSYLDYQPMTKKQMDYLSIALKKNIEGVTVESLNETKLKDGWMLKQGDIGPTKSNWKKRWFVLTEQYLYYFQTPKDKSPKGAIKLDVYQGFVLNSKRRFSFCLYYPPNLGLRNYKIATETSEELESWRDCIEKVLKRQSKPRSATPTANVVTINPDSFQKYTLKLNKKSEQFLNETDLSELNKYRDVAYEYKLIGAYSKDHPETPEQGYGCLSKRWTSDGQFIITTRQSGLFEKLTPEQYILCTDCHLNENTLYAKGVNSPSASAMVHGALYHVAGDDVQWVLHIHQQQLWENWEALGFLHTPKDIDIGTPDMAREIQKLYQDNGVEKVVAMLGHRNGLIAWGPNIEKLIQLYKDFQDDVIAL